MALTLDDIMKLPAEPTDDHLAALGLLRKPELPPAPVVKTAMTPATAISANATPFEKALREDESRRPMHPTVSAAMTPAVAPDIGTATPPASSTFQPAKPMMPPELSQKDLLALPQTSAGVHPGSSAFYQNQLERMQAEKEGDTLASHPGLIGKIGHVLGRVGNVALDVAAPSVAALIPGTDINKAGRTEQARENMERAQTQETAQAAEKTRELHEENVADLAAQRLEETKKANESKDSASLAKQGLKRDDEGNIVADEESPIYKATQEKLKNADTMQKNLMEYRNSQKALTDARTELEKAKNDPNSPIYKQAQQRLAMAQVAHDVAAKNLELHEHQFENKLQEQELIKPSGQSQSRGSAAQAVLDLIPDLKTLVNKHREDMGPLMGRINRGEVSIGSVDPGVARLYSAMKSFYALQPAVHGFRNAEFVKDFESALGTLERDPDAFIAGMEGLKPTLESVAKEGKTFHKRVVEGRDTQNQPAGAVKPPDGKVSVWDPEGKQHFIKAGTEDDFLKEDKYKGWSKNAPSAKPR